MHQDGAFTIFLVFGILWALMGVAAVVALFRLDNQPIRVGKWGLVVALPIIIPFVLALVIAARLQAG
ncbi:MAG TPA: hypothetical protein IGS53_13430 [Leptolyngbyaceae cyanobacterium M33_DOE_097]|uniref:Uncharacterized protein n=1 Tax=Oscillatoriales cyanobacterium SpSt-418 TaxID=2282169 RepID=A0A7C3KCE1_9CYAN|nr:hypothetical protein [Leptolyngbyaceae cyanobacterium M33_DOE_097]